MFVYVRKGLQLVKENRSLLWSPFTWRVIAKMMVFKLKTSIKPSNYIRKEFLMVHASHHKVMTVYFDNAFRLIAFAFNLKYQHCKQAELAANTNIFLEDHSHIDASTLPRFKGTHIVRDPRDIVISGYFYHKWCSEIWVRKKNRDGLSYQERLNATDLDNGLLLEINRLSEGTIKDMRNWNYHDDRFLNLKYEDLISPSSSTTYSRIFCHYGFDGAERGLCIDIMKLLSFQRRTGRRVGELEDGSHLRSGRPGEWKKYLNKLHVKNIKGLFGDVIVDLGYESDNSW